ncbi:MAG TPA: thioesterase family protein [Smithella sp.]|nr:thioesterase family protein [Smithella sp.]
MTEGRTLNIDMPITVKTYDIDFMGIVSNISYVRWMEDLRLKFLEVHYSLQKLMADMIVPILSHTQIDYKKPVRIHDAVIGSIWMEKYDSSGWIANMEFSVNGKVVATGAQGGVFINIATMKRSDPPEGMKRKYEEALLEN